MVDCRRLQDSDMFVGLTNSLRIKLFQPFPLFVAMHFFLAFQSCRLCFSRMGNEILVYMVFILPGILGSQLLKP